MNIGRLFIFLSTLLAASCSFDAGHDCTPDEIAYAERIGEQDALNVCEINPNTMEHEQAILEIRVKEEKLRDAGFNSAADAYADAAERTLRDNGLIP